MPPEYRTRALVLRTFDHGESDRLVHLYTQNAGRVSAMAKGARRSRRRFPGTLEIFSILDVRLVDPPRSSMMRLEGARLVQPLAGLTDDLVRYAIACQFLELLDRLTGEGESHPGLFEFAAGALEVVAGERADRLLALLLLAKTLARLGYRPQLARCAACDGELGAGAAFDPRHGGALCGRCAAPEDPRVPARILNALDRGLATPLRERGGLGLSAREVERLERLIERFFRFHIGFDLRSAAFLRHALATASPRLDGARDPTDTPPAQAPA